VEDAPAGDDRVEVAVEADGESPHLDAGLDAPADALADGLPNASADATSDALDDATSDALEDATSDALDDATSDALDARPSCAASCLGCCDASGACTLGFLDSACGSGGVECADCTAGHSTCDTAATRRGCVNTPRTCPASYGACPTDAAVPTLTVSHACSASALAQWNAACAGPATFGPSAGCSALLSALSAGDPSCAACLRGYFLPSVVPNADASPCVNTFQTADCQRALACFGDCESASCGARCGTTCVDLADRTVCSSFYATYAACTLRVYPTECEDATAFGLHFCGP
jgi:hypothetical protein